MTLSFKTRSKTVTKGDVVFEKQQAKAENRAPKRLNVEVDYETHQHIRMLAVRRGKSVSEMTRELWAEYLKKNPLE